MKLLYLLFLTTIITTTLLSQNSYDAEYDRGLRVVNHNPEKENGYHNKAIPVNDNFSNATDMSIGDQLLCGQTTESATTQKKEYFCNGGGTPETVWYRFTALNDSLVLSFIETNNSSCSPHVAVYGPYDAGTEFLPINGNLNIVCVEMASTDRGLHQLITNLVIGKIYKVQIEGRNCGNTGFTEFCIGIANPLSNTTVLGASLMDACGTGFNGNTSLGNYPSGSSTWNRNVDLNNSTSHTNAIQQGDDVTYHINNDSWFSFIPEVDGTWQVNIDGIANCHLSGTNGIQASIFIGDPSNLINIYDFPSPMAPGSSNLSTDIVALAGDHIYILIDGWAGDACDYVLTLTNIVGGCKVSSLPIELTKFNAIKKDNQVEIKWETLSETNNDYFTLLKSIDGKDFEEFKTIQSAGNSNIKLQYSAYDNETSQPIIYYRLKQTDFDGRYSFSNIISVKSNSVNYISDLNIYWDSQNNQIIGSFKGFADENYQIIISDITGRIVYNETRNVEYDNNSNFKVSTNDLQKGIYQITVLSNTTKESKKIIISK